MRITIVGDFKGKYNFPRFYHPADLQIITGHDMNTKKIVSLSYKLGKADGGYRIDDYSKSEPFVRARLSEEKFPIEIENLVISYL